MKYAGFLTMYFGCLLSVLGQQPVLSWIKTIGGTGSDAGIHVKCDMSGNIFALFNFSGLVDFNPGSDEILFESTPGSWSNCIAKYDNEGNLIWVKMFGSTQYTSTNDLIIDNLENIIVTGSFYGTSDFDPGESEYFLSSFTPTTTDMFILKLDNNGNFISAVNIGGTGNDSAFALSEDSESNLIVTGKFIGTVDFNHAESAEFMMTSAYDPDSFVQSDVFLLKLSSDLEFIWARQFGGAGFPDSGNAIAVDHENNIWISGSFMGDMELILTGGEAQILSSYTPQHNSDVFVLKLNSDGVPIKAYIFGEYYSDYGLDLCVDSIGNAFLTGIFQGTIEVMTNDGLTTLSSANASEQAIFLTKFDSQVDLIWARSFSGPGIDIPSKLICDNSGNLVLSGRFKQALIFEDNSSLSLTSNGAFDMFMASFDLNGNTIWTGSFGGTNDDSIKSITLGQDGSFIVTGSFENSIDFSPNSSSQIITSNGSTDIFVMKFLADSLHISLPGSKSLETTIEVFPNPSAGLFAIQTPTHLQNAFVAVHNLTGRQVYHARISGANHTIDLSSVPTGLYILSIGEGRDVKRIKILKE